MARKDEAAVEATAPNPYDDAAFDGKQDEETD